MFNRLWLVIICYTITFIYINTITYHPGDTSAGICSPLAGPAGSSAAEEGAGPAADLAGGAGDKEDGGEGGAAERPPAALDETTAEGGFQPIVPRSGE